jgi:hypothetical protein
MDYGEEAKNFLASSNEKINLKQLWLGLKDSSLTPPLILFLMLDDSKGN